MMEIFKNWVNISCYQIIFTTFCFLLDCALMEVHDNDLHTRPNSDIIVSTEKDGLSAGTTMPSFLLQPSIECTSTADKAFKFALTSHRNSTGNWIADIHLQHGEDTMVTKEHPFEIQLEHKTTACTTSEDPESTYAQRSNTSSVQTPKIDGYRHFPGFGFYKRHQKLLNWRSARDVCKSEGADLVVINSEAEAKVLLQLSASLLFLKPVEEWNAEAYVGIYDFHHEGHFSTVTGQSLEESGYISWSEDEPNNFKEEDCVTLRRNSNYNDVQCRKLFEFICEIAEF